MKKLSLEILFLMNLYSSLSFLIPGMETSFSISRHNVFSPISLAKKASIFSTTLVVILLSVTLYIVVALIPSCDDVSLMKRMNTSSMTVTLEPVAVTFLGWLPPRKFYVLDTFGPPSSRIVWRPSKSAHLAKFFKTRHTPTLLRCIPLFPSAPFPNGALISCSVSLPQLGGMVI
jgi:hypothetical protein